MTLADRFTQYEKLMRLDKPIGILLLLWPTLWGMWIAWSGRPHMVILWIFILGTVLMRSAGVVINDLADRNLDPHVRRTRDRPLAAGRVTPREALLLAGGLSLTAFLLILPLRREVMYLALVAFFLAASYPFTKRFFALPQAYLGIAFGFGIPMAFASYAGQVPALAWLLLLANVFWALAYDTEYAMVDREDDLKIGIKTAAITFGKYDVAAVMASHGIFLAILAGVGAQLRFGAFYFLGLAVAVGLALYQYRLIRRREPQHCFKAFLHNNWVGAAIFAGIALDYLFRI
ncbi:MAG: 4-hydroxybenzoate octaprenyltransferase [Betaproteobacteria bacterium]|nr:4-hydroxybenzoate octaprenyltransferase [Betaproteobacteria bacterium]